MWKVSVGYCGPTDCCLKLTNPEGKSKEYLIESVPWFILDIYYNGEDSLIVPDVGEYIFSHFEKDERK